MKCEYCGKETGDRFCSRECRNAVYGFDDQLAKERKIQFDERRHTDAHAEWVDGVRLGSQSSGKLDFDTVLALADRDSRLPAIMAWTMAGRPQEWIGERLGVARSRVAHIIRDHKLLIARMKDKSE